jgi:phosphate transport system substrate-binding protein
MKNIFITVAIVILVIIGAVLLLGRSSQKPETEKQSLTIKGSDTEVQLVSNLVEAFLEKNPKANISVTGGGSGVGIAALINSEIDMANSSREMKQDEKSQAASRGLDVQEFILARDGLSIIVHTENPIARLSLEQLGKIYFENRIDQRPGFRIQHPRSVSGGTIGSSLSGGLSGQERF